MKSKLEEQKTGKTITFFSKRTKFSLEQWVKEYQSSLSFLEFRSLIEKYLESVLEQAKLNGTDLNRNGLTIVELLLNWSSYLSRRIFFIASDYQHLRPLEDRIEKHIKESPALDVYFKEIFEKKNLLKEFNEEVLSLFERKFRQVFMNLFLDTSNKYIFGEQRSNENQDKETRPAVFYDVEETRIENIKKANQIFIDAILYRFLLVKCNHDKLAPEKIKNSLVIAKRLLGHSLSVSDTDALKYSLIQEFHYKFNDLNKNCSFNKKSFHDFLKKEHCTDLFTGKEIKQVSNGIQRQRELYLERENTDKNQFINEYIGSVRKHNTFTVAASYPDDSKSKIIKNIIIIGAGPIGLYLAALFAQKEMKFLNITVVEPRIGNYNRKKIISSIPVESILAHLGLDIYVSNNLPYGSMYIKDFEESLYEKIRFSKKIRWLKGWFLGFGTNSVLISQDKLGSFSTPIVELPCDMVFDCTGTKRAVLSGLNTYLNRDFFVATEIGKNLFRFHCVTYVTLPAKMVACAENPIHWAKQVTKLREEYGWPCYGIPNLSINYVQLPDGNYKYFFYYEISSTLIKGNRERQIAWLYDLLSFQFECPDSELTDLVIDCHECFEVNPLMVKEKFYYGDCNTPAVLACGDAGIEPDYHLEFGIQSGMNRVDCLVKAIKFNEDMEQVIFHFEQYAQLVEEYIVAHQHEMERFYSARKENINRWLIVFTEKINLLIDNVDQPEDAILLATCSKEIGEEFFKKNRYHEAINCYSISLKFYTQYNKNLNEEPAFIKCNALIKALQGINCYNDRLEYTCNLIEELKRNFEYIKLNLGNNTNQLEARL